MKIVGAWVGGYYPQLFGYEFPKVTSPMELSNVDLMVMWGGADISPALYGETVFRACAGNQLTKRDKTEVNLVSACKKVGIPILAICRGAQLVCAMAGGGIYQHVDNHEGINHKIIIDGEEFNSNSAHHQVMIPTDKMKVIAYTPCRSSTKYRNSFTPIHDTGDEPEIVWMPEYNCLGIQGHPEWLMKDHDLVKLTKVLTKDYLNVDI